MVEHCDRPNFCLVKWHSISKPSQSISYNSGLKQYGKQCTRRIVVLLLPHLEDSSNEIFYTLSLASTYAGNLFTIGSMANLIVIEQARILGVNISFREYAKTGIAVTTLSILILFIYFNLLGFS